MHGYLKTAGTGLLVTVVLCSAQPAAQARDGAAVGAAVGLGLLGGVVAGSAIASANNGYYPGRPVYRAAPPPYEEACHIERRSFIDRYGYERFQRVEVCE